jgi:hypothetical protein
MVFNLSWISVAELRAQRRRRSEVGAGRAESSPCEAVL